MLTALLLVLAAQQVILPRAVPYLPQTEALCGGAAAAMVMRYWGAEARAEDFAALINDERTGIVTTTLVEDLRRRGWQAFPLRGSAGGDATLRQHLARGRPIVALIEDRPSRFHYVVVTELTEREIGFHDPARAPSQRMPLRDFDRRWQAANFWMLLLLPGAERTENAIVPASPFEEEVASLLRAGRHEEALRAARGATVADPANAVSWDALGTTLFVMDREVEALRAWNRAGKPVIDTVQLQGGSSTRFRVVEDLIDLSAGEQLTANGLLRARRRLSMLPSAAATRVSYAPQPDGRVQIDAGIADRSRAPGWMDLALTGARAPLTREIDVSFASLIGAGERLHGEWRFREGFERVEVAVETPAPLPIGAVWRLSGVDSRETYEVRANRETLRRRGATFQAIDWLNGWLGIAAAVGYDRWPALGTKTYAGGRLLFAAGSSFEAHLTLEGWMRGAGATRAGGMARLNVPAAGGGLTFLAGSEGIHGRTPAFLNPGAGDGNVRRPLLRAHPLVEDGAIRRTEGQIFGRRLLHGTAELSRPVTRRGLASVDAAIFVDAARAWQLLDGRLSEGQIDAGAGIRVRALGSGTTLRLDAARGLLDGRWAFSAGTTLGVDRWIRP